MPGTQYTVQANGPSPKLKDWGRRKQWRKGIVAMQAGDQLGQRRRGGCRAVPARAHSPQHQWCCLLAALSWVPLRNQPPGFRCLSQSHAPSSGAAAISDWRRRDRKSRFCTVLKRHPSVGGPGGLLLISQFTNPTSSFLCPETLGFSPRPVLNPVIPGI